MKATIERCIQFAESDGFIDGKLMDKLFAELEVLRGNTCDKVWQRGTPHEKRCILWAGHEKVGQPHRPDDDGELTSQHEAIQASEDSVPSAKKPMWIREDFGVDLGDVVVVETPIDDEEGEMPVMIDKNTLGVMVAVLRTIGAGDYDKDAQQKMALGALDLFDGHEPDPSEMSPEVVLDVDRDDYEQALSLVRRFRDKFQGHDDGDGSTIPELILEANELLDPDPVQKITQGRTIYNSDGTDGPCLITTPPAPGTDKDFPKSCGYQYDPRKEPCNYPEGHGTLLTGQEHGHRLPYFKDGQIRWIDVTGTR